MSEAAGAAAAGGAAGAGDGGAAAAAAAAAAGAPAPWHTGIDGDLIGHAQNKGWKIDDPKVAFSAAAQAHREAQSKLGVPPEQLLRLPKDQTDEAGWKAVYGRLGVPEDAKDYDLTSVKLANGTDVPAGLADALRAAMHAAHTPKDRAADVVKAVVKHLDASTAAADADKTAKLAEDKAALAKNWGKNEQANKFIASQAAQKLGVAPETVASLEGVVGYRAIMEMFHKIGMSMGEDKFVAADQNNPGSGIMSRDQAQARKSELMSDRTWADRYTKGDIQARREMRALNVIISGDDGSSYAA